MSDIIKNGDNKHERAETLDMKDLESHLEKVIRERIQHFVRENIENYRQQVAEWFATIILTETRKAWFEVPPAYEPYDRSGDVEDTKQNFSLKDYKKMSDFLEEYTGEKTPTYTSGYGWSFITYEEELEELTDRWVFEVALSSVVKDLIREKDSYLKTWIENLKNTGNNKDKMVIDIDSPDIYHINAYVYDLLGDKGDSMVEISAELRQSLMDMQPKILFSRGKKEAQENLNQRATEREEKIKNNEVKKEKVVKLWEKIKKMYKLRYAEEMPEKVEMSDYKNKLKPLLIALRDEGVEGEDIRNISIFIRVFFNSVKFDIYNYF